MGSLRSSLVALLPPAVLALPVFVEREAGSAGLDWSRRHGRRARTAPSSPTLSGSLTNNRVTEDDQSRTTNAD
jgi:hypothetical protein